MAAYLEGFDLLPGDRVTPTGFERTIEVEFEANEDQDENVLRAALFRGRSGPLRLS
jgi:hypothetical protein